MPKAKLTSFFYRTFRDGRRGDLLCFYAPNQLTADRYCRIWIIGRGITVKRIKGKPGSTQ